MLPAESNHDPKRAEQNLLNGLSSDVRVFRFMSVGRFCEMVSDQQLVLRRPHLWDDPFENFLLKTTWENTAGEKVSFAITQDFFGQCWTLRDECDGFWRNYCSLGAGVRIETTAGKLLGAVWDGDDRFVHLQRFAGRVRYLTDDALKAELEGCGEYGHSLTAPSNVGCAQALLIKRSAFSYEQEVRVLVDDSETDSDQKVFPVVPCELIHSVMFAPRMADAHCEACTEWLINRGFDRNSILRSALYDPWTLQLGDTAD